MPVMASTHHDTKRLFVAVPIREDVQQAIYSRLVEPAIDTDTVIWRRGIQCHCTLAFVGPAVVSNVCEALEALLQRQRRSIDTGNDLPVEATLERFSHRDNATLRVILRSCPILEALSQNIKHCLNLPTSIFESHVTLAFLKDAPLGFGAEFSARTSGVTLDDLTFTVDRFCLYSSSKDGYTVEREFVLRA